MMARMQKVLGFAWYHKEHYDRLRTMFADGDKLHPNYEQWFHAANLGFQRFEGSGTVVEKVYVTPDEF